jgi:predicted nucleotidyltransferase
MQDFDQLLQRLADSGIEFVIVGGYAAVIHGSAYITRDLDICAVLTPETVERLRDVLAEWNPKHRMTPQRLSFLEFPKFGTVQNLYLQTDVGVIDILSSILGVGDFARLKANAEMFDIDGRQYPVLSLQDLIAAKEAVGREKDLLVAKELKCIAAKRQQGDA